MVVEAALQHFRPTVVIGQLVATCSTVDRAEAIDDASHAFPTLRFSPRSLTEVCLNRSRNSTAATLSSWAARV